MVQPRDEDDVRALVRYAAENNLPLVPRGAGTGVAGESLGAGLVVDLSRHFRTILEVGDNTVRVQPGVVLRDLSAALAAIGRRFAPDPANLECTVGGMLATNASGARAFRHGYTRDHVESLRVVLDTGEAVTAGRHPRHALPPIITQALQPSARLDDIVSSLATLLEQNAPLIRTHRPRTRFNRCGYLLHDALSAEHIDLARLLVGSEGTLGLFTEATLRTLPLPGGQALVLLAYHSLDAALQAAQRTLRFNPVACDLFDRRLLAVARSSAPVFLPPTTEAVLLVEFEADNPAAARSLAEAVQRQERQALRALVAVEPDEVERLGRVRGAALPGLYGLRGAQAVAFVEDVAVPPRCCTPTSMASRRCYNSTRRRRRSWSTRRPARFTRDRSSICARRRTWPVCSPWPRTSINWRSTWAAR